MDWALFLKSLVIGFSIAAPVGPIGVLCIRRTLLEGRIFGLVSGLGAASADAIYSAIAGLGLTFLSSLLLNQQDWIRLVGGGFLCYLGVKAFFSKPAEKEAAAKGTGLLGAYLSTFALTITNPLTILSFAAVFASFGLGAGKPDLLSAVLVIAGVFTGSATWWFLLSGGVSLLRKRFDRHVQGRVNKISGLVIMGFGLAALVSLVN